MNKVILMGRLTRDPEVRYSQGEKPMAVAKYTLAVDRKFKKKGEQTADFINCVCFGKPAEFAQLHLHQGMKIVVVGAWQTGSYNNKDGQKVYTNDCIVNEHYFCESKNEGNYTTPQNPAQQSYTQNPMVDSDGFMNIPDGIDAELPFN